MSKDIWVISDLHYNHANILNFIDYKGNRTREFDTVDQMNEFLIDRWNSVVKPGDIVYTLGDTFFGSKDEFKIAWPKFNGSKRLIVGNHDDIQFLSSGGFFKKTLFWRMFTDHGLVFHHVPFHLHYSVARILTHRCSKFTVIPIQWVRQKWALILPYV
jgi:calcineurin-like phosphoesterase family protein